MCYFSWVLLTFDNKLRESCKLFRREGIGFFSALASNDNLEGLREMEVEHLDTFSPSCLHHSRGTFKWKNGEWQYCASKEGISISHVAVIEFRLCPRRSIDRNLWNVPTLTYIDD